MLGNNRNSSECFDILKAGTLYFILLAALLLAAGQQKARAAIEGEEIEISVDDAKALLAEDQQNPYVISLSDKGLWFVIWEDTRDWQTTGSDIYGRFIKSDGSLCGSEVAVSTASGNQTMPAAAYRDTASSGDTVLVAWQDTRGGASSGYVYYKGFDVSSISSDCTGYTSTSEHEVSYTQIARYNSQTLALEFVGDGLLSRKSPKIAYDPAGDLFWITWIESRNILQMISEPCFNLAAANWVFGDPTFPGYVQVYGTTLAEKSPADIMRNGLTRTNRLIASSSTALSETYEYEYFTDLNNISIASDSTAPEVLLAWEGISQTGNLTCNCADLNENEVCDSEDTITSSFSTANHDDGKIHIHGLFNKQILLPSTYADTIDASSTGAYHPAIGFDPVFQTFLVAWEDLRDGPALKIYGQLLRSGGGHYNGDFIISYSDTDDDGNQDDNVAAAKQTRPNVAYDGSNQRFFVTWEDGRNTRISLENLDIYGQFIDSEGSLRGDNLAITIAKANQLKPITAYNRDNHQFLTIWKDARNVIPASANDSATYSDIYGQRFTLGQAQITLLNLDNTALEPLFLDFGTLNAGQSSTQSIKLRNSGDTTLHIDCVKDFPLTAPFAYSGLPAQLESCECEDNPDTCQESGTLNLIPSGEYTLSLSFTPTVGGTFIDRFTIMSDAGAPGVTLQGIGLEETPVTASISTSPEDEVDFGEVSVGDSKSMNIVFTNNGNTDVRVTAIDAPKDPFTISGIGAGTVISANSSLNAVGVFASDVEGTFSSSMSVLYDSGAEATNLTFSGASVGLRFDPDAISFSSTSVGDTVSTPLNISNRSAEDLTIESITLASPFSLSGAQSGTVISAGMTLELTVSYTPTQAGSQEDDLEIQFSGEDAPRTVTVSGSAVSSSGSTISTVYTNTSNVSYALTVGASWQWSGRLFGLLYHNPLTAGKVYAYTADGQYKLFANGLTPVNGWENLYYSADASSVDAVDFGSLDLSALGGTLYAGSFVSDGLTFDFQNNLLELAAVVVNTFDGEWEVTDTLDGVEYVEPEHLVITDQGGRISAVWGALDVAISYGDGSGYVLTFSNEQYSYTYIITELDDTSFSGTWTYSDGTTSTTETTTGIKIK